MSAFKKLLSNKWLLYIVSFLSLTSIFGYLVNDDYAPILFFIMVAFLTNHFSKNMILILGISLLATNFLAGITNVFQKTVQEGFDLANKCNARSQQNCGGDGCSWDPAYSKCVATGASTGPALNPAPLDSSETVSEEISISETINKANNFFQP